MAHVEKFEIGVCFYSLTMEAIEQAGSKNSKPYGFVVYKVAVIELGSRIPCEILGQISRCEREAGKL